MEKLIYGAGINDSDCNISKAVNGRRIICPFYRVWIAMLERCYSDKYKNKRPTYIECTTSEEWRSFMGFKKWMEVQEWEDRSLDKDIIIYGNKLYSPETCAFVRAETNNLFMGSYDRSKKLPIGVFENGNNYKAKCGIDGGAQYLGTFLTVEEASIAYWEFKKTVIRSAASRESDIRIKNSLITMAAMDSHPYLTAHPITVRTNK